MERVIFLVDMNAFFISCEMAKNPELKGRTAAVAGDPKKRTGIILAANYEARKYGVKTTMLIHEAKKLCPDIILIPPSHGLYEKKSREVMSILSRYSPVVQQNSIDEAWLDMTGCEALFGKPVESAKRIMKDIMNELDLWCSIGISENKFLAKMASEFKKPLGITELWRNDISEKLWPLPVREMYGIGKQTEKNLIDIGIYKIGDIAKSDPQFLIKKFGKYGGEIYRLANGIDESQVSENPISKSKSVGRTTTLPQNITDLEYAKAVLLRLAEDVGMEARKQNYKGKTISIAIRYEDFKTITRQKSIRATYLTKEIYAAGADLLEDNWDNRRPVRLLGISLNNISEDEAEQISIFNMDNSEGCNEKEEKLEKTFDLIRERFGSDKIKRAVILKDNHS
ncbi:DNA polymerase IV [Acetivibrio cellulolyticus]|uniref:DNA polymerase IV n=1 Tax=Acetivibrio cellulolyticus TaxID=35830 RepID=UPI0001E2F670|nr:DNA polymerase IV [Acetivibrio cellulolyticus]